MLVKRRDESFINNAKNISIHIHSILQNHSEAKPQVPIIELLTPVTWRSQSVSLGMPWRRIGVHIFTCFAGVTTTFSAFLLHFESGEDLIKHM
jgi:hypothetical protein